MQRKGLDNKLKKGIAGQSAVSGGKTRDQNCVKTENDSVLLWKQESPRKKFPVEGSGEWSEQQLGPIPTGLPKNQSLEWEKLQRERETGVPEACWLWGGENWIGKSMPAGSETAMRNTNGSASMN